MNKMIVVTGASSGIGKEVVKLLITRGYFVIMLGRNVTKLNDLAFKLDPKNRLTKVIYCELADLDSIKLAVNNIQNIYRIDALINVAGLGYFMNIVDLSDRKIREIFQTNTLGLIYLTKYLAKIMIKQDFGQIINVASMSGKIVTPKTSVYGASKAAVIAFSNGLRLELKKYHIKVSTVNTGPVQTAFFNKADQTGNYLASVSKYALSPRFVATKVVNLLTNYRREVNLPWYMEAAAKFYPFVPKLGDYLSGVVFNKK